MNILLDSAKKYIFMILLLLGVTYTGWLLFKANGPSTKVAKGEQSRPDLFMKRVTSIETDENGQVIKRLTTPSVLHYQKDDKADLETPVYIIYQSDQKQPWVITALQGTSLQHGKKIILNQQVNIHEKKGSNNDDVLIATSSLTYYPNEQLATTDQHVTIQKPDLLVTAIGMNAYLAQKKIDLLSNTRGVYAPEKATS